MAIEAHDWNVVVIGAWNPAILTPAGIARRLFKVPAETPVLVEVAMDGPASPRVRHDRLAVCLRATRLIVDAEDPDFATLQLALAAARNALQSLPETPFSAAGFNLRYRASEMPSSLAELTGSRIDDRLSDAGYRIVARTLRRSVDFREGRVNVSIESNDQDDCQMHLNFERRSDQGQQLIDWLSLPIKDIEGEVAKLLGVLDVQEGVCDVTDERDE